MHRLVVAIPHELHRELFLEAHAIGLEVAPYVRLLLVGKIARARPEIKEAGNAIEKIDN